MTVPELVEVIFDRGGTVWVEQDANMDALPAIRHKSAPRIIIAKLREFPHEEVATAIRAREQKIAGAREWFFGNLMPVTNVRTSKAAILKDYEEFCQNRGEKSSPRYVNQLLAPHCATDNAFVVDGFMLMSDFVVICKEQRVNQPGRFQKGDVVYCSHYTSFPRLVVLEICGADLLVSVPKSGMTLSNHLFWLAARDCELAETV
ncbi:MAG TPA: hypothetical protein VHR84_10220 [Terriglobales bacterium]|jgi:hypothetical protein|nr:hypothetical protein [Terriglobales bacterium]